MNEQTLDYHTRLHEWYRQHSIQQERQATTDNVANHHYQVKHPPPSHQNHNQHQQQQQHQQHQPRQTSASTGAKRQPTSMTTPNELIALGVLSRDKLHFIDNWCSEVNRTMFSIKKKEASPLFRKCRISSTIKTIKKDKTILASRRARSAEVYTTQGEWSKAPKANIQGGELLGGTHVGLNSEGKESREGSATTVYKSINLEMANNVDLCVTNSLDKSTDNTVQTMARVNHDSFNRRIRPSIIKKHNNSINIPSASGTTLSSAKLDAHKSSHPHAKVKSENNIPSRRIKSANFFKPMSFEEKIHSGKNDGQMNVRYGSAKTLPVSHKISDNDHGNVADSLNNESGKLKSRLTSASMRSQKAYTDIDASIGDAEVADIINRTTGLDPTREGYSSFCSKCSGIYSGNAPPPPTPATCGSCVHGITIDGKIIGQGAARPSNAEIQKELAQKLVQVEKNYHDSVTNADIQLKMAENRVSDNSIHYSKEREMVQNGVQTKTGLSTLKENSDFPDNHSGSIDIGDNHDSNDEFSIDVKIDKSEDNHENIYRRDDKGELGDKSEYKRHVPTITINTDDNHDCDRENVADSERRDSIILDEEKLSAAYRMRRNAGRRMSIHFSYKPEVGNISISNKLLHFLTIDDCKQAMRYHPHKILEKHEVTDNPMVMLANSMAFQNMYGDNYGDGNESNTSSDGKGAMRISKGSTITTLPSSTANNATKTNKKQYKILFDPEDLDFYKNKQPDSKSLARAFNTLIYDRTIMQRLENKGYGLKSSKAANNVGRTQEGPKYRLMNAALKKQIGEKMQAQSQQMLYQYQRKKSGIHFTAKKTANTRASSLSSERSLSLDSLPSVKKGMWEDGKESQ